MKNRKLLFLSLLITGIFTLLSSSCKKDDEGQAITTTVAISSIAANTAVGGGNITSDGGSNITMRGVCWSTSQNPTISDSKSDDGTGTGAFISTLLGLSQATTYYVRSYATNTNGTAYGNQVSFKTKIQMPNILTATIDGVNFNASSISVHDNQGKIGITGITGSATMIVWLPSDFTVGAHAAHTVGDYVINYSPYPGSLLVSSTGTISIIEYNASSGKIVGTFNCTAQGASSSKIITNGSFVVYK